MIFITKKQFETEVCKRVEIAMSEEYRRKEFNRLDNEVYELKCKLAGLEDRVNHREGSGRPTSYESCESAVTR